MYGGLNFALRKALIAWIVCVVAGVAAGWRPAHQTRLDFLSVGQGDCAVFQTEGNVVLIDAGPKTATFDAGKRIVVQMLETIGAKSVDLIFLTHPDVDHIGGIGALHKSFPKARIAISAQFKEHREMQDQLHKAKVEDHEVTWLDIEQAIKVGEFKISIKNPPAQDGVNDNEGSMFLHLIGPSGSAVFSGDAGSGTEKKMEPLDDWSSQVLKVGHHGSKGSTATSWLREVRPQYAVVSCGLNNMYGHPAAQTMTRLSKAGVVVFRTDKHGHIRFDYEAKRGFTPSGALRRFPARP